MTAATAADHRHDGTVAAEGVGGGGVVRVALDDIGPPHRGRALLGAVASAALALPAAAVIGGLLVWPVLRTLWTGITGDGLGAALDARGTTDVLARTLLWATVAPAVITTGGLALAVAAARRWGPGDLPGTVTRTLLLPLAVPLVAVGVAFRLLFDDDPDRGLASALVSAVDGLLGADGSDSVAWLGPRVAPMIILGALVWAWLGLSQFAFAVALAERRDPHAPAPPEGAGPRPFLRAVADAYRERVAVRRAAVVVFALVALASARTFDLVLVMVPGSARDDVAVLGVTLWQSPGAGDSAALGTLWLAAIGLGVLGTAAWRRWVTPVPFLPPLAESRPKSVPEAADPGLRNASSAGARRRRWWGRPRVADAVLVAVWGIPALTLVATALRPPADAATSGWWTGSFGLGSFEVVLERWRFAASLVDTAGLAATVALLVVGLGLAAAYALAWLAPPQARTGGVVLLVLSAVVPVQVVAAPISQVLEGSGLAVGPAGFVLVHVALGLPFAVLVLREELERVNWDPGRGGTGAWVQQARLEGARERDVAVALLARIRPAIVAIAVLEVVQVWNDLAVSLFFQPAQLSPLGSLVFGQTREFTQVSGPLAASALLMAAVPVMLVVLTRRSLVTFLREVLR